MHDPVRRRFYDVKGNNRVNMRPHLQVSARSSVRDSKNALNVVLLLLTLNLFIFRPYGPLTARVTIMTITSDIAPTLLPPGNVLYAEF